MASKNTSLISFLSTEHGRMRREQRDIDKRDIKEAIKHGTRTHQKFMNRLKIEHDGIIFITDRCCTSEVTAYPSPLAFAALGADDTEDHNKAKTIISRKPELCASHTVLVIDNSGSMSTHDILHHRDRQTAAYSVASLELVAEQLFSGSANNSDVVSLVEFSDGAKVVFEREPVSWVLYNKLLARRDSRGFNARQQAQMIDIWRGDSNYLPALKSAERLLSIDAHETCALSLFFISDGAPSDSKLLGLTPQAAIGRMTKAVEDLATRFDDRLSLTMVGFGNSSQDFQTLESMVAAFNASCSEGSPRAEFMYCNKMANGISSAISNMVTSTTQTRVTLTERERLKGRTKRVVASETKEPGRWHYYPIVGHFAYNPACDDFYPYAGLPPGALRPTNQAEALKRQRQPPPLLALRTNHCGEGAERLAYRCYLANRASTSDVVLAPMVAKETNLVERIEENIAFHKCFCETQSLAAHLAVEFNQRLHALSLIDRMTAPRISFIECSVLVLEDSEWPGGRRGVLVEKMLDVDKYEWLKWNDNVGAVNGKAAHIALDVEHEFAKLDVGNAIDVIEEGDSDIESDSDDEVENYENDFMDETHQRHPSSTDSAHSTTPEDYLQAFTHFTYRFTNSKVLVCDLQGIFNQDEQPPTFELTDPAIHYASKTGREMVFGRTDKGKKGIKLFFKTHKCSAICKRLQLSRKNKHWNQRWRGATTTNKKVP